MAFDHLSPIAQAMTQGGDARIVLNPEAQVNRYNSTPYPRTVLAYASSTANDLSHEAAAFLHGRFGSDISVLDEPTGYADFLEHSRSQIRAAYALDSDVDIFFAPSGTDLEYVPLFAAAGKASGGISNLLLGSDEVGSGCIHSAAGCYFANETALGAAVAPGQPVAGMPMIEMGDFPVRDPLGTAFDSHAITAMMIPKIEEAIARNQHPLVHIVHGSKTGLVLPHLDDIDLLLARFGQQMTLVVDACQARITTPAVHDYLARGIIVFLTGSKFMGGPPFSGFALLPAGMAQSAAVLPEGAARIFRKAEVPAGWAGADALAESGNAGLALRLAASLFELERFQALSIGEVARLVSAFTAATDGLAAELDVRKVGSAAPSEANDPGEHPIEMQTLVTLDLSHNAAGAQHRALDFDDATRIHKAMMGDSVRLGQPVRCVKLTDGRWGATLRIGVSMPQLAALAALDDGQVTARFTSDLAKVAASLAKLID